MATDIELTWWPDPPQAGSWVTIWATLDPMPPEGAHVWIYVDDVTLGQSEAAGPTEADGNVAWTYWLASTSGQHEVRADATLLDTGETPNSKVFKLDVAEAPAPAPAPSPEPSSGMASGLSDVQSPQPEGAGVAIQSGSNAFNGASNIDPFTGAPAADPYTGEPLSERDASIYERIKAVYSTRDAVTESARHAILDIYNQPAIDLTGVPQSVQNSILDIFNQVPETRLPGVGLDEYLSALPLTAISTFLGDVSGGIRSVVGAVSSEIGLLGDMSEYVVETEAKTFLRTVVGEARMIEGTVEIAKGIAITGATGGLGALAAYPFLFHGVDELVTGFNTITGGDPQSVTEKIFTDVWKPIFGSYAPLVGGLANASLTYGLSGVAAGISEMGGFALSSFNAELAATRPELSVATLVDEAQAIAAPVEQSAIQASEAAMQASEAPSRIAFIRNMSETDAALRAEMGVGEFGVKLGAFSGEFSALAARDPFLSGSEWGGEVNYLSPSVSSASRPELSDVVTGRSSLLGPGNRLPIINPDFEPIISAEEAFQGAQRNIVDKFAQNPKLVGNYLTNREIGGLIDAQAYASVGEWGDLDLQSRVLFGKAVERGLVAAGQRTELLASTGQPRDVRGRFVSSPDFRGLGPFQGLFFESTTNAGLAAHMAKGYPATTQYATYDIPLSWFFFLTP